MLDRTVNRRAILRGAALTSAVAAAATQAPRVLAYGSRPTDDDNSLTPDQILSRLLDGNRRFAAGVPLAPRRDPARVSYTAGGQAPFAAVLGCADSRVPIEVVFDQGIGDLFITRVAGNVATPDEIASLEYGTEVLGAKLLIVLGHSDCGAIQAAAKGQPVPGQISGLFQYLQPGLNAVGRDPARAVASNVQVQTSLLGTASTVLSARVKAGQLVITGAVYDVATGLVSVLTS